jgi:branched-chain amino acid aminotransferase
MTKINWDNIGFGYIQTDYHIRYQWKNGVWDKGTLEKDPYMKVHVAATGLHYGQSGFEGLKAFRNDSGQIHIFRPAENAKRLARTANRVMMAEVPEALFLDAIKRVVDANSEWVPPAASGGSLYIRPLLFGSGAEVGLSPSKEYTFIVLVTPVGNYYKEGVKAITAFVSEEYDRAAPRGTGSVKVAGNYASSLYPGQQAKERGYPIVLYLDSSEQKYIEEFGTSNFIGITADKSYVTPSSQAVLPSITNLSLMAIAEHLGYKVEQRVVPFTEIDSFIEVGACGTAVVISPINRVVRGDKIHKISDAAGFGPHLDQLHDHLKGVQSGRLPDLWHWNLHL